MATIGDRILDVPLSQTGEKGLFTKELELALIEKRVDMVVHSLKDLGSALGENCMLTAVTEREDPRDVVILKKNHPFTSDSFDISQLPSGSVIGSSSVRRITQLKQKYPNLVFETIRGNLNTRLSKLDESGKYDALILATAALFRLGMESRISQILNPEECLYAVGQGALGIESRTDCDELNQLLKNLEHTRTRLRCEAERSLMKTLEGGCSVPIGVSTEFTDDCLKLVGRVSGDSTFIEKSHQLHVTTKEDAKNLGEIVANLLIDAGARELINKVRGS